MGVDQPPVLVERRGAVLTITLNRPDLLNAIDLATHEALAGALEAAGEPDVRAVVLTGAGRGFCVGQDVGEFPSTAEAVGDLLRRRFNPAIRSIRRLPKPVVAAINGPAAGAGLALALACDLRIAGASAVLVPAFLGIALAPDSGLSQTLPGLIGDAAAFEWLVSNNRVGAEDALRRGLVHRIVLDDELEQAAAGWADELAAGPTLAIGLTKQLLTGAAGRTLDEQLEAEAAAQVAAASSADFAEGVAAFSERRPPRFGGR